MQRPTIFLLLSLLVCSWGGGVALGKDAYRSQSKDGDFEGVLNYVVSRYSVGSGKAFERQAIKVFVTGNRLLFPTLGDNEVFEQYAPPGVTSALIRNERSDIVLFGEEYDAYHFRAYEMKILGMALRSLGLAGLPVGFGAPDDLGSYELRGFKTRLFRYAGEKGTYYDLYFAEGYKFNWGVLGESWLFGGGGLNIDGLDKHLSDGKLPVRIEMYSKSRKLASVNLVGLEEIAIADTVVTLPQPRILHSTTRFLMEMVWK